MLTSKHTKKYIAQCLCDVKKKKKHKNKVIEEAVLVGWGAILEKR